ncbi:MAG TPA: LPS assembly lipoprotein LptE [Luteimonas sp.]|nr:LPS assembly lipoprotein LptE [Luteimonas sp.]
MSPIVPLPARRPALRAAAVAMLALLLAGCGFHLRDALLLPPDLGPVRVQGRGSDSELVLGLRDALRRAGARMADPAATDAATLRVVSERWANTPISIDQFGRSQEYTLRYAVIFRLQRADGTDLVPQQAIELSRDYISVPTRSAGTESEREILTGELRREMLSAVLRRIDAVSRLAQAEGTTP